MALNKQYSLKNRYIFYNFQKLYKLARNKYLTLLQGQFSKLNLKKLETENYPKVVFIVRKKEVKSAVKRNKIKRKASEAYRVLLKNNQLNITDNTYCLIFILRANILELKYSQLLGTIKSAVNNG